MTIFRTVFLALLLTLGVSERALAQQQVVIVTSCGAQSLSPFVGQRGIPYMDITGTLCTVGGSGGGGGVVTVGPYAYTPLSPGQHNVAITSSTGLTIPSTATYAIVCASTAAVKYTTDGTTTPTSSVGMPLASGACIPLSGATVLANFKAISATGTLDVEYYK